MSPTPHSPIITPKEPRATRRKLRQTSARLKSLQQYQLEKLISLGKFKTILADPPWQFANRTGKMAPEHRRLNRYSTMTYQEILELPVAQVAEEKAHLYLWVPNALILEGLEV